MADNPLSPLSAPQVDYILLDGSSSMYGARWTETLSAIDAYIATLRTGAIDSHIILQVFDDRDPAAIHFDANIKDWRGSHFHNPGGSTPLYDAINAMGRSLRDRDPELGHIIIATDGDENASRYTDQTQAAAILDWCRAKGWPVTFIGCDFNNSRQARALGASDANSVGVQQKLLVDAARNLASKRRAHYHSGDADDLNFSDDERAQFGGYLTSQ